MGPQIFRTLSKTFIYFWQRFGELDVLYVGVTYDVERSFKWLKKIGDAYPTGVAALKLTSQNALENQVVSSVTDKTTTSRDTRVNVMYE